MGLIKKYFANMGKPEGKLGKIIVSGMNSGHASLSEWGFSNWSIDMQGDVLDIGCGCGAKVSDAKWTKIMDVMTIYTEAEIKALLEQAGFSQINVYRNEKKGWISFSATKQ